MSNQSVDIRQLLIDSRETLFNPKEYFSSMPLKGGYAEPVLKAAVFGVAAGLCSLLWTLLGLSALGGTIWSGPIGFMALIYSIIGAIMALFIGGGLMLLISAICGGNTDYESNVRVAASLMVTYPINAFMAFLYGINVNAGSVVGLAITCLSIYLIYHAVVQSLKGKEPSVKMVAIVLVLLSFITYYSGRKATQSIEELSDMFEQEQVD